MSVDLTDRVALVTGAGAGIGRATALGLAHRGARVGVLDLDAAAAADTADVIVAAGGEATAVVVDIGDEASVREAVTRVGEVYGGLDVAVNNAGVAPPDRPLTEVETSEWDRIVRIDLTGTYFCLKYEIPLLAARGGGSVVNVASNGGLGAIPAKPAYVAAKHGVVGLSKAAAVDHARDGIRVNALCPALTRTPMYEAVAAGRDLSAALEAATPLGRPAEPEEIAEAAVWLCSTGSSYVTGTALSVDGGRRA